MDDDDSKYPADFENLGEESDVDENDEVEQGEADLSCEQDAEGKSYDKEDSSHTEIEFYLGRNKQTKWTKKPSSNKRRSSSQNIIVRLYQRQCAQR